jgi:hypothetical protein
MEFDFFNIDIDTLIEKDLEPIINNLNTIRKLDFKNYNIKIY